MPEPAPTDPSPAAPPRPSSTASASIIRHVSGAWRWAVLISLGGLFLGVFGVAVYFCWIRWMIPVWNWGFDPVTWRAALSLIACFYLGIIPLAVIYSGSERLTKMLLEILQAKDQDLDRSFSALQRREGEIDSLLASNADQGLVALVKFSQERLSVYHRQAQRQAQRSYRHCIVAMWVGFLVILLSIAAALTDFLPRAEAAQISPEMLTFAAGLVLEGVAALFFWMYRATTREMNRYHRGQLFLHSVLIAERITAQMKEPDPARVRLVEAILTYVHADAADPGLELPARG
ncbi:MAG: hypothetical protein EA425_14555 [Puniceicoccaceae bacterium]|nr:MAG: hypothetical protein EA425_14555 [Puniceicoccaceae bacterium]